MSHLLTLDGQPAFLLGVNYWSRAGGPRMWERFDAARVRAELEQMRAIGLNVCRSFAFLPSFMPQPGALAPGALQRLREFFELCQASGMRTIPSALVGHMSGENFDFPGQHGRCPYSASEVLGWQELLVRAIGTAGAGHPAVAAYLASNEMPLWGGKSTPETIVAWARALRRALHSADPARPFSLGDGVMNLKGGQNGFDVDALRDTLDFVGPHSYYGDSDPLRQALNVEFCVRSLRYLGLPVLFEEFGCSSNQAGEREQALYYREVVHSCLSAGAAGALGWCYSDFDLGHEPPYDHHAFELTFGITRADGSEKPVCDELRAVARLLDVVEARTLCPPTPRAAIIVPSYFNTTYPFSWEDRDRMRRTLLQAYTLCVKAGFEAELVPERALDCSGYRLVLAPATQKLLSPTWDALLAAAAGGATVYWSYFGGDYNFHQGAWCSNFEALTGCQHHLRYGCFDLPEAQLVLHGEQLSLGFDTNVGGRPYPRALLPLEPLAGHHTEVLARDQAGRPALTRKRHGAGQVLLLHCPLEYYLAEQADINERDRSEQLYRFLAAEAGLTPLLSSSDPLVQVRSVETTGSTPLLWVINRSWRAREAFLETPGGRPLTADTPALREGATRLALAPKQIAVYRLASAVR
jgi:endo-1,4-beta-mannosidase